MSTEKRYQVFVSSTFVDLKEERSKVIQTLMEMDCIPAGMELFPAADEEQFEFIKRIIDDCDYYIVIIGGRYGSTTADGISYTKKEYEYAASQGIKVIALLHENPGDISASKSEWHPEARERLERFREQLTSGRLVKFWSKATDLPGLVALSVNKAIKMHPAVGWIRANSAPDSNLLQELNELRKDKMRLQEEVAKLTEQSLPLVNPDSLADMDETITIEGSSYYYSYNSRRIASWSATVSWGTIFSKISPYLLEYLAESSVKKRIGENLFKLATATQGNYSSFDDQQFQTIKIQLLALGLVSVEYLKTTSGTKDQFWCLTNKGKSRLFQSRVVERSAQKNDRSSS